jgi:hypothetical protein
LRVACAAAEKDEPGHFFGLGRTAAQDETVYASTTLVVAGTDLAGLRLADALELRASMWHDEDTC